MYATLLSINIEPGKIATAEHIATELTEMVRDIHGFRDIIFLFNDQTGEYKALSLWDLPREEVERGAAQIFERVDAVLSHVVREPPERHFFEVYKARPKEE